MDEHGICVAARIVHNHYTGSKVQCCTSLLGADGTLGLDPYGLAVSTHNGHANTCCAHANVAVHDLASFLHHLHLLASVIVILESIDVRNDIVSELMLEVLHCGLALGSSNLAVLQCEFVHSSQTCATCCLISSHLNILDV